MFWHKEIGFRPVEEKDLEDIRNLRNDPTTWIYLSDANQINPIKQKEWFERISRSSNSGYWSVFKTRKAFPIIATDKLIGIIRADEIDVNNRSVRVGCDIVPSERGNGYGTMVFEAILKYWFDNLGMHRVWLCVLENNEVARKLYRNVGFQEEGRYREAIWREGKYHDYIVMSILVDEYKKPKLNADSHKFAKEVKEKLLNKLERKAKRGDYWKSRAKDYDKLDWVNDDGYIKKIIEVGDFKETDHVLDVGTGTGVMACATKPLVEFVHGIDISSDMLPRGVNFSQDDIRYIDCRHRFDKVIARMVFHHIKDDTQLAMNKCFEALKPGGKFIIAENIPPVGNAGKEIIEEYSTIMHLKEDRLVFEMHDIIHLMKNAGFINIEPFHYTIHSFSVRNWLDNNALSDELRKQIWDLHENASDDFKRASNMIFCQTGKTDIPEKFKLTNDIHIDSNHIIITGEKPCI